MLGVIALGATIMTSTSVAHLDALVGRGLRSATGVLSPHASSMVSALGGSDFVLPLTAGCVLLLSLLRHWRGALTVVMAVGTTQVVVHLIKTVVERPRPRLNGTVAEASGFSFPSAHSATAMALYATITFIAARACRGPARAAIAATGVVLVAAIGTSRVLVAAHYPIDVVAGWLTGAALVVASTLLVRRLGSPVPQTNPV